MEHFEVLLTDAAAKMASKATMMGEIGKPDNPPSTYHCASLTPHSAACAARSTQRLQRRTCCYAPVHCAVGCSLSLSRSPLPPRPAQQRLARPIVTLTRQIWSSRQSLSRKPGSCLVNSTMSRTVSTVSPVICLHCSSAGSELVRSSCNGDIAASPDDVRRVDGGERATTGREGVKMCAIEAAA